MNEKAIKHLSRLWAWMLRHKWAILISLVFCVIYCLTSLVNHYLFRTSAYDMGYYNKAAWGWANLRLPVNTLHDPVLPAPENFLADHFSFVAFMLSPFMWLFGSYTLLLLQIASILFGGWGVYWFFYSLKGNKSISAIAMAHFFTIWGIYFALGFDFHDNVVATMIVPWYLFLLYQKKWKSLFILFVLMLFAKQNIALWMGFINLGLIALFWKERRTVIRLSMMSAISFVFFALVVAWIIPLMDKEFSFQYFTFSALGNDLGEAFKTVITRPFYTLKLFFINHLDTCRGDGLKTELHIAILLAGGVGLLLRPQYLLMALPIFAQKLLNDDLSKWGVGAHYSIEFAPLLTLSLFMALLSLKRDNLIKALGVLAVVVSFSSTIYLIENSKAFVYYPENMKFYAKEHYRVPYDVDEIYKALDKIPDDAIVSAQDAFTAHLALREVVYLYPEVADAEYLIISPRSLELTKRKVMVCGKMEDQYFPKFKGIYPMSYPQFRSAYEFLVSSPESRAYWEVLHQSKEVLLLKRRKTP